MGFGSRTGVEVHKLLLSVGVLVIIAVTGCQSETAEEDDLLGSARARLEVGEYAEAVAELEAIIEDDPGNSGAHFLLGQAYNQDGDLLKAADEFRTVLALEPDNGAAHHNLGVTFFQLRDPNAAVTEFQAALELDPDDPDTRYQLGATYLVLALSAGPPDAELLAQATTEFEAALDMRENMPEALIGIGNIHIQRQDFLAGSEVLKQALEGVPDSPEAHYALAQAYALNGDTTLACETYGRFIELSPPADWRTQATQAMSELGC